MGLVPALRAALQDAQGPFGVQRGFGHHFQQYGFRQVVRTGAGGQNAPGAEQAERPQVNLWLRPQMDFSPYEIAFTAEGQRRVHAFSYLLAYSCRQYVRFVETQDFTHSPARPRV